MNLWVKLWVKFSTNYYTKFLILNFKYVTMKVSVMPCLYDRRIKSNGKYPVKLKLIFNREKRFYNTGIDLSKEQFNRLTTDRSLKKQHKDIIYYLDKADKIIETLGYSFSFKSFDKQFLSKKSDDHAESSYDLIKGLTKYKSLLESEGRWKSADSFQSTISQIDRFIGKKKMTWDEVDYEFLKKFDTHLKSKNLSESSIGIYMRNIRTVFNIAITEGIISKDLYPFGRNKYTPPTTRNVKKALSVEDIRKLHEYIPENEFEAKAKDFWFFSYYANGLNIKDICLLKYSNIIDDEIQFYRQKTRNSRKEQQKIYVILTDELRDIIKRRGKKQYTPDDFIFDRMPSSNPNSKEISNAVNQTVKFVNDFIKRIAEKIELTRIPTTNFARHTYSTVLKRAGVPIELISENLGHSSIKTTQLYLDSFEKEQRKEAVKFLTAFKNKGDKQSVK